MFYTYVLQNENGNKYIGLTNNLKRRFKQHSENKSYTTKKLKGPWKIIYYEVCENEFDARKREKYLKSGRGRAYLKKRLSYYTKFMSENLEPKKEKTRKYIYRDNSTHERKIIFECVASGILEADKKYMEATGMDPEKQSYIGCSFEDINE